MDSVTQFLAKVLHQQYHVKFIIRAWLKFELFIERPCLLIDCMNENRSNP